MHPSSSSMSMQGGQWHHREQSLRNESIEPTTQADQDNVASNDKLPVVDRSRLAGSSLPSSPQHQEQSSSNNEDDPDDDNDNQIHLGHLQSLVMQLDQHGLDGDIRGFFHILYMYYDF